jgi:hypothetical protein
MIEAFMHTFPATPVSPAYEALAVRHGFLARRKPGPLGPRFEFVRQPCRTCGGSGHVSKKSGKGFYTVTQKHNRRPSCGDCSGRGHIELRRKRLDVGWDQSATHHS